MELFEVAFGKNLKFKKDFCTFFIYPTKYKYSGKNDTLHGNDLKMYREDSFSLDLITSALLKCSILET